MRLQHSFGTYSIDVLETMVRRCQLPDEPQLIFAYLQKIEKLAEKTKSKRVDKIFALGQRAAEILYECAADDNLPEHHRMLSIDNIYRPLRLMSNNADSLTKKGVLLNLRYRLSALNFNY